MSSEDKMMELLEQIAGDTKKRKRNWPMISIGGHLLSVVFITDVNTNVYKPGVGNEPDQYIIRFNEQLDRESSMQYANKEIVFYTEEQRDQAVSDLIEKLADYGMTII